MNHDGKKIIVIDDEDAVLFAHEEVLTELGFAVDTAQTYEDAVKLIYNHSFDIIVTDLNLYGNSLLEGMNIIRKAKGMNYKMTVIVVSAYGDDCIKKEAFAAGADYFIEKPISSECLKDFLIKNSII